MVGRGMGRGSGAGSGRFDQFAGGARKDRPESLMIPGIDLIDMNGAVLRQ